MFSCQKLRDLRFKIYDSRIHKSSIINRKSLGIIEIPVLLAMVAMIIASVALFATSSAPSLPNPNGEAICDTPNTFKIRIFWSNQGGDWLYRVNWEGHTGQPDVIYDTTRNASDYIPGIAQGPRNLQVYVRAADPSDPNDEAKMGPTAIGIIPIPSYAPLCVATPAPTPPGPPIPTVELSATPLQLASGGGLVTLNWTTTGSPNSCTAQSTNPNWQGFKNQSGGTQSFSIVQTTTFSIQCTNGLNTSNNSVVTVNVSAAAPPAPVPTVSGLTRQTCYQNDPSRVLFGWNSVGSGYGYEIRWDGQSYIDKFATTSHNQPGFAPAGSTIHWYVRAYDFATQTGGTETQGDAFQVPASCGAAAPTPGPFNLTNPTSGETTSNNPGFYWSTSQNANRFYVYIGTPSGWNWFREVNGAGVTSTSWNNGVNWQDAHTSQPISSQTIPPGNYIWSVGAHVVTGGVESPTVWSTPVTQNFIVPAPPAVKPAPPTNLKLEGTPQCVSSTAVKVKFQWDASPDATSYEWNIDKSGIAKDTGAAVTISSGTFISGDTFHPSTDFAWWQVRSIKAGAPAGDWIDAAGFTTPPCALPKPGAFSLVSPANNATNVNGNPTFDWQDSTNAANYGIYIASPTAADWQWYRETNGTTSQVSYNNGAGWTKLTATTNAPSSLTPGIWRYLVQAFNADNSKSTYANSTFQFRVGPVPASAPQPPTNAHLAATPYVCSADGAHVTVNFQWDASPSQPDYYELNWANSGVARGSARVKTPSSAASYQFAEFEPQSNIAWWEVRAVKNNLGSDPWTVANPPEIKTIACAPPVQKPVVTLTSSAPSVTTGGTVTLTWSATNNPTSCTASGSWSGSKNDSGSQVVTVNQNSTYTLVCNNSAGASEPKSVTVTANPLPTPRPGVFDLDSPANGATVPTNKPNFTWGNSANVDHYYIQIGQNGKALWYRSVNGNNIFWTGSTDWGKADGNTTIEAPDQLAAGTYSWNVAAYSGDDKLSTNSSNGPRTFIVPSPPAAQPDPPATLNEVISSCNPSDSLKANISMSWSAVPGATGYELNWAGSDFPKDGNQAAANSKPNSYTNPDFSAGSNISWWQVRTIVGSQKSIWKDGTAFNTATCPAPSLPRVTNTTCTNVTLAWDGTGGSSNNKKPGEVGFWLDVSKDQSFNRYSNKWVVGNSTTTDNWSTADTVTSLVPGETYYARIFNGEHSPVLTFTYNPGVSCLPQIQISNIRAINNYSGPDGFGNTITNGCVTAPATSPTFGKAAIRLLWDTNPPAAQSRLTWDFGGPQSYPESGTTPDHGAVISGWENNKPYTVTIHSEADGTKPNEAPANFTTVSCTTPPPAQPNPPATLNEVISSCNASDSLKAKINMGWSAVPGATGYELNWAGSDFPKDGSQAAATSNTNSYSNNGFSAGSNIGWWQIRTVIGSQKSIWKDGTAFNTATCPAPSLPRVSNTTCTNVTLAWDGTGGSSNDKKPGEVGFWLDVSKDQSFNRYSNKWVVGNSTTTDNWSTADTVTTLIPGETYYARVFNGNPSPVLRFTYSPSSTCSTPVNLAVCSYTGGTPTKTIDILKGENNGLSFTVTNNADTPSGPWVPGVKFTNDTRDSVTNYASTDYKIPIGTGLSVSVGAANQRNFNLNALQSKQVDFIFYADPTAETASYKLKDLIMVNATTSTPQTDSNCTGGNGLTINVKPVDGPPDHAPLDGAYVSGYGFNELTSQGIRHPGLDLSTRVHPQYVRSPFKGEAIVTKAGNYNNEGGYGNRVDLKSPSGKWTARLAHLKTVDVSKDQVVAPDQILGIEGNTGFVESNLVSSGVHLHYEVTEDGKLVDPEKYNPTETSAPPATAQKPTVILTSDKSNTTVNTPINLSWTLGNDPTSCEASSTPLNNDWIGNINPVSGTKLVHVSIATTFTLTCSNLADTATDQVLILIDDGKSNHSINSLAASCNKLNLNNIDVTWDSDPNVIKYQLQLTQKDFDTPSDETFESYESSQPGYTVANIPSNASYSVRIFYQLKGGATAFSDIRSVITKDCATAAIVIDGRDGNESNLVTPITVGTDVTDAFATVVKYNPGWNKKVTVQVRDYQGAWHNITGLDATSRAQIGPDVWVAAKSSGTFTTFPYAKPYTDTSSLSTLYNMSADPSATEGDYTFEARIINSSGSEIAIAPIIGIANVRKQPTEITQADQVISYLRQRFAGAGSYSYFDNGSYPMEDVAVGVAGGETGWDPKSDGKYSYKGIFKGMWQFGPKSIASVWCCGVIPGSLPIDSEGNHLLKLYNNQRSVTKISPTEWADGVRYKSPDGRTYSDSEINPWRNSTDSGAGVAGGCIEADARCNLELSTNRFEVQTLVNNALNSGNQWQPWDTGLWTCFKNARVASDAKGCR